MAYWTTNVKIMRTRRRFRGTQTDVDKSENVAIIHDGPIVNIAQVVFHTFATPRFAKGLLGGGHLFRRLFFWWRRRLFS